LVLLLLLELLVVVPLVSSSSSSSSQEGATENRLLDFDNVGGLQAPTACGTWDSRCSLEVGVPYDGDDWTTLEANTLVYLQAAVGKSDASPAAVLTSVAYGNVKIYATSGLAPPSATGSTWSSVTAPMPSVVTLDGFKVPSDAGTYLNVLIVSVTDSRFRLLVEPGETSGGIPLTTGVPQLYSLSGSAVAKPARFLYSGAVDSAVLMSASALSVGADVSMSVNDAAGSIWPSEHDRGTAYVRIPPGVAAAPITIAVNATGGPQVGISLAASSDGSQGAPPWLLEGLPLHWETPVGRASYFVLDMPGRNNAAVNIYLRVMGGNPDLIVSSLGSFPDPSEISPKDGVWSSASLLGDEFVGIAPSDKGYLVTGGRYFVTVAASATASETEEPCRYALTAYSSLGVVHLVEGVALAGSVDQGGYSYFQFFDTDPLHDLLFTLTSFAGNADMFVGCQSSPTGDDSGYPSQLQGHAEFDSRSLLEDAILVDHSYELSCLKQGSNEGATFYVAVRGSVASRFTLMARHMGTMQELTVGRPQRASTSPGSLDMYTLRLGPSPQRINLHLAVEVGDPDMYVTTDGQPASPTHWQFSSIELGSLGESISIPSELACVNCYLSIAVRAFLVPATYSIVATVGGGSISLRPGLPQLGTVGMGGYTFYTYVLAPGEELDVSLTLTPLSGDVSLVASLSEEHPEVGGEGTYSPPQDEGGISTRSAVLTVTVPVTLPGSTIYVGVHGDSTASFTLLVEAPLSTLVLGQPQDGTTAAGEYRYYTLLIPRGHGGARLSASPRIGTVALYARQCLSGDERDPTANCSPLPTVETATQTGIKSIELLRGNSSSTQEQEAMFVVGVLGGQGMASNHFSLVARQDATVLTIVPNRPVTDFTAAGGQSFFQVLVSRPNTEVTVSVTPTRGDADLYVSSTVQRPGIGNATWTSELSGADTLTILPSDEGFCGNCMLHIGVRASPDGDAEYTLLVNERATTDTPLSDGVLQADYVGPDGANNYELVYNSSSSHNISVTIFPSYGDPDMWLTLDGRNPSPASYDFKSNGWGASDEMITVGPSDPSFQTNCASHPCHVRVSVTQRTPSEYSIVARLSETSLSMRDSVPYAGVVSSGGYSYYDLEVPEPAAPNATTAQATFLLSRQSGSPVLYLSCNQSRPTVDSHDWALDLKELMGAEITVPPTGYGQGCPAPATFHAGVHGSTLSTFSLLGKSAAAESAHGDDPGHRAIHRLPAGVPLTGGVEPGSMDYFSVQRGAGGGEVQVTAVASSGAVDLFVSPDWERRPRAGADGSVEGYSLKASGRAKPAVIQVAANDSQVCPGGAGAACTFIAAVHGAAADYSAFVISQQTGGGISVLQDSIPAHAEGSNEAMRYWTFSVVDAVADLRVSLTPLAGDPDLFIISANDFNGTALPSMTQFTWASMTFGGDALLLQADAMAEHCRPSPSVPCELVLGVYCWSDCSYSILVGLDRGWETPILLALGQPQTGRVSTGGFVYYKVAVGRPVGEDPPPEVVITVSPRDGGDADMYMTTSRDREPGPLNYDEISASWAGSDVIVFGPGSSHYCSGCEIYVAVSGFEATEFSIVASSGLTRLREGIPQAGSVEAGGTVFYAYSNPVGSLAQVMVTLTSMTGDADLFMSNDTAQLPRRGASQWHSANKGVGADDFLAALPSDPGYCSGCDFIVGVGAFSNSSFTVTAHSLSSGGGGGGDDPLPSIVTALTLGRPQSGHLQPEGATALFSLHVPQQYAEDDLSLSLTMTAGSADLYVAQTPPERPPIDPFDPSTYQWKTAGDSRDELLIQAPHGGADGGLTVAVIATDPAGASFSLLASVDSGAVPNLLQAGVPQTHTLRGPGAHSTFEFAVDQPDEDVQLTLTTTMGDADMFVHWGEGVIPVCTRGASTEEAYDCEGWTWASTRTSMDTIFISHSSPCRPSALSPFMLIDGGCDAQGSFGAGPLMIAVYSVKGAAADTPTTFSIVASLPAKHVALIDGRPQHSSTSPTAVCERRDQSGGCLSPQTTQQVAYFSFLVRSGEVVGFSIPPECPEDLIDEQDCRATVLVNSCESRSCTAMDTYPTATGAALRQEVGPAQHSVLISSSPAEEQRAYCAPLPDRPCTYYIAVVSEKPLRFVLTASTPQGVQVLSCELASAAPDGVFAAVENSLGREGQKDYEVCSGGSGAIATLEVCSGSLELLLCDGTCEALYPTDSAYVRKSAEGEDCEDGGRSCEPRNPMQYPYRPLAVRLEGPAKSSIYFVSASGEGTYRLRAQRSDDSVRMGPAEGPDTAAAVRVVDRARRGKSARIAWPPAVLFFGGEGGEQRLCNDKCVYTAYAAPSSLLPEGAVPPCAVEELAAKHADKVIAARLPASSSSSGAKAIDLSIDDLSPETDYSFFVIAKCDYFCMKALYTECGNYGCQSQSVVYAPGKGGGAGAAASAASARRVLSFLAGTALLVAGMVALVRWRPRRPRSSASRYEPVVEGGERGHRFEMATVRRGREGRDDEPLRYQPPEPDASPLLA
jgi:hypothetical protein